MALASLLLQQFIPFIQHELEVDLLAAQFVACLFAAANSAMPQVCKLNGVHSRKHQAWFDSKCKQALKQKEAVYKNPHSAAEHKIAAEQILLTGRRRPGATATM